MITVTPLKPRHNKDNELVVIGSLFLTQDRSLMLNGYCSKCLSDVTILIRLSELYDNCPEQEDGFDTVRMHALGVYLPTIPLLDPPE